MVTSGLLEVEVFWNKGYDVINSVHDVTNKTVNVVMSPKFVNCSISMRKVIITSIL